MTTEAEPTRELVEEILRAGLMITGVLEDLLEALPEDAFPGESQVEVLLEMLTGTMRPAVAAAGDGAVREAIALLGAVCDRVLKDLEGALAAARARSA